MSETWSKSGKTSVVFVGMVSATLLDQLVTPALFYLFGRRTYEDRHLLPTT